MEEEKTGNRLLEVTFYFTYQSKKEQEWKETLPECCEHQGRRILIRQENKGGTSIHQKSGRFHEKRWRTVPAGRRGGGGADSDHE